MKVNPRKDVLKNATGTTSPTNGEVIGEKKFSVAGTTDKMGITTGGAIAKGFIWGVIIGAGAMLALGIWKNKINISYTK